MNIKKMILFFTLSVAILTSVETATAKPRPPGYISSWGPPMPKSVKAHKDLVKRWINSGDCVSFASKKYTVSGFSKAIWVNNGNCPFNGYGNTNLSRGQHGGRPKKINATNLINYFNKYVYSKPFQGKKVKVTTNRYFVPSEYRYNRGYLGSLKFNVSFTVKYGYQKKKLSNLLEFKHSSKRWERYWYVYAGKDYSGITEYLSKHTGSYYKQFYNKAGNYWKIPQLSYAKFIDQINFAIAKGYWEKKLPITTKYPKDWLPKMVQWIRGY